MSNFVLDAFSFVNITFASLVDFDTRNAISSLRMRDRSVPSRLLARTAKVTNQYENAYECMEYSQPDSQNALTRSSEQSPIDPKR